MIDDYQDWTEETALGPATSQNVSRERAVEYLTLALNGEAGELAELVKRVQRGEKELYEMDKEFKDELGDVLWYLCRLADELELDMSYIMDNNVDKLSDRKARDVIHGSGDDR